jgi:hypothetical protein
METATIKICDLVSVTRGNTTLCLHGIVKKITNRGANAVIDLYNRNDAGEFTPMGHDTTITLKKVYRINPAI